MSVRTRLRIMESEYRLRTSVRSAHTVVQSQGLVWPRMRSLPRSHAFFHSIKLIGGDVRADHLAIGGVLSLLWPFYSGGKIEPVIGLNVILRHALPHKEECAKRALRSDVPLLRSLAIPVGRVRHVARKIRAAIAVKRSQGHFCGTVALVRRLQVPLGSLRVAARNAFALGVEVANGNLRGNIAVICFGQHACVNCCCARCRSL